MKVFFLCILLCAIVAGGFAAQKRSYECTITGNLFCSHGCLTAGCCGHSGICRGLCYCYGSGYEHRCNYCDA